MAIFSVVPSWRAKKHYERNTTQSRLYALRGRLRRDDFYRWRRYLVGRGGLRRVIWCVGCAAWHRDTPDVFPQNTHTLHRKDRWCHKSIAGQLMICPHRQFYFSDLIQLIKRRKFYNPSLDGHWICYGGFWYCKLYNETIYSMPCESIRLLEPPTLSIDHFTEDIYLKYYLRLFGVPFIKPITHTDIVAARRAAAMRICPHMATDDEGTIEKLGKAMNSNGGTGLMLGGYGVSVKCGVL